MSQIDELIGRFIHHCGSLEYLTNISIEDLQLNSQKFKGKTWNERINLLKKLLEKNNIVDNNSDKICNELHIVRKLRNTVAHNPIISKKPYGSGEESGIILEVNRDAKVSGEIISISREDLEKFVGRTGQLLKKFSIFLEDNLKNKGRVKFLPID